MNTPTQDEGIFDVPEKEYHSSPGVSKSILDKFQKSPKHYQHALGTPTEETPAMKFGSLAHCVLLEPNRLSEEYAVAPKVDRRTKAGKAEYAEFLAHSEGKVVVSEDDMFKANHMANAVRNNELANSLMEQNGVNEKSIYSICKETNIMKRGRLDRICEDANMIIDYKTTTDGSAKGFQSSIFKFNYHKQAAYYIDLAREQGLDINRFVFVVCEKEAPYAVSVFELDEECIELGRAQYQKDLRKLDECINTDEWPSYSTDVIKVTLPSWM